MHGVEDAGIDARPIVNGHDFSSPRLLSWYHDDDRSPIILMTKGGLLPGVKPALAPATMIMQLSASSSTTIAAVPVGRFMALH
jgi:hypothetical protein